MAHYEPSHQDLRCLQIQLFSSLVNEANQAFNIWDGTATGLDRATDREGFEDTSEISFLISQ